MVQYLPFCFCIISYLISAMAAPRYVIIDKKNNETPSAKKSHDQITELIKAKLDSTDAAINPNYIFLIWNDENNANTRSHVIPKKFGNSSNSRRFRTGTRRRKRYPEWGYFGTLREIRKKIMAIETERAIRQGWNKKPLRNKLKQNSY